MRISMKRGAVVLFLIFVFILTWNLLTKQAYPVYTQTCNQLESVQQELHLMTHSVHSTLQDLNVTNFLCYGTLWGQIRLSRILPWEDKTMICILNKDISNKDELLVARAFKNKGLDISYDFTDGMYKICKSVPEKHAVNNKDLMVYLPVFELDKVVTMYRRIGWQRRLLPPDCERLTSLDCFPPRLIKPPLPWKEFGGKLLPVPREGIEIQKYHFRDNWWKEVTIKNC